MYSTLYTTLGKVLEGEYRMLYKVLDGKSIFVFYKVIYGRTDCVKYLMKGHSVPCKMPATRACSSILEILGV